MGEYREIVYFNRIGKQFEILKSGERHGKKYDLKGVYDLVDSNPFGWDFFYSEDIGKKLEIEKINRTSKKVSFSRRKTSVLEE